MVRNSYRIDGVGWLKSWALIAMGVGLASHLVPGISYDSGWTLLVVVLVMSLLNTFVKPIVILFTLPFVILTLGFGLLLINGFFFLLVSKLVDGFAVDSYFSAFVGGVIVSAVSLISNLFMIPPVQSSGRDGYRRSTPLEKSKDDDIIDL